MFFRRLGRSVLLPLKKAWVRSRGRSVISRPMTDSQVESAEGLLLLCDGRSGAGCGSNRVKWAFLWLAAVSLAGCEQAIVHDLTEGQAIRVKLILAHYGISAEESQSASGWSISVANRDAMPALEYLESSRVIPEQPAEKKETASAFLRSREERAYFLERELAANLEQTLRRLPGVLEARVHLFVVSDDRFFAEPQPAAQSASVLLIEDPAAKIDPAQVRTIIAGASGVKENAVAVLGAKVAAAREAVQGSAHLQDNQEPAVSLEWAARLALISSVLLLLGGLLVYWRRNRQITKAGTIAGSSQPAGPNGPPLGDNVFGESF